jgi:hypothetical protein
MTTEDVDQVLDEMAAELHDALVASGADPRNPPQSDDMPTATFFAEYKRRGGDNYDDAHSAAVALIERVKARAGAG